MSVTILTFVGTQGDLFPSQNIGFLSATNRQVVSLRNGPGLFNSYPTLTNATGSGNYVTMSFDAPVQVISPSTSGTVLSVSSVSASVISIHMSVSSAGGSSGRASKINPGAN